MVWKKNTILSGCTALTDRYKSHPHQSLRHAQGSFAASLRSAPVGAKRASTGRSAPPKVSTQEPWACLVPGQNVTSNTGSILLPGSGLDQILIQQSLGSLQNAEFRMRKGESALKVSGIRFMERSVR